MNTSIRDAQPLENQSGAKPPHANWLPLAALLLLLSGCQSFDIADSLPWSEKKKIEKEESKAREADRIVAAWTETTYREPGKPTTRGFGGRLYFYDVGGDALAVEGQLVVYAYDESKAVDKAKSAAGVRGLRDLNGVKHSKTPDRKFVFTAEQFKRFESKTPLGVSYSVWIPWDREGGPTCDVTLLPILTTTAGKIIQGEQTLNVLPGVDPEPADVQLSGFAGPFGGESGARSGVKSAEAAFLEEPGAATLAPNREQMRTSTLNLPPTMRHRLVNENQLSERLNNVSAETAPSANLTPMQRRAASYFANQEMAPEEPPRNRSRMMNGSTISESAMDSAPAGRTAMRDSSLEQSQSLERPPTQSAARFGWPKRRARGEPIAPPDRDRAGWRPNQ